MRCLIRSKAAFALSILLLVAVSELPEAPGQAQTTWRRYVPPHPVEGGAGAPRSREVADAIQPCDQCGHYPDACACPAQTVPPNADCPSTPLAPVIDASPINRQPSGEGPCAPIVPGFGFGESTNQPGISAPLLPGQSVPRAPTYRGDDAMPPVVPPAPADTPPQPTPPSSPGSSSPADSPRQAFGGATAEQSGSGTGIGTANNLAASLGATAGSRGAPNMIGDNFGGAGQAISIITTTERFSVSARGFVVSGMSGSPNAVLVFETTTGTPNDFFSVGPGTDTSGNGNADTFAISEPIPPNDAPTSPGPGFTFDGGTANNPTGTFLNGEIWNVDYAFSEMTLVNIPVGGAGGGGGAGALVGRLKIAENSSPLPRDRIFVNYSSFNNVPLSPDGPTVNRFSVGFEKTLLNGLLSYEFRLPMASTLESNIVLGGPDNRGTEIGNMMMAFKALLYDDGRFACSIGTAVTAPTANDLMVVNADRDPLVRVRNRTVHLMPYVGYLFRPSDKWFTQGFIQLDFDVNGDPILVDPDGTGLRRAGRLNDPTFLYLDWAVGYWLYDNPQSNRLIQRVASLFEIHNNTSLQDNDVVQFENFRVGDFGDQIQRLNVLFGAAIQGSNNIDLLLGYVVPVGNRTDQQFDGELRVVMNRRF